jgi:hypothetical protein
MDETEGLRSRQDKSKGVKEGNVSFVCKCFFSGNNILTSKQKLQKTG